MNPTTKCPCCGYTTLYEKSGSYEICPVCFWEDDSQQSADPTLLTGANRISLIEAKKNYAEFGSTERSLLEFVRPPEENEK